MANGWFVFALVASIVLFTGFVLAIAILRAAWAQKERESLTASDLRALEESAVLLIDQLASEADRSIAEVDGKCSELKELIAAADQKLEELREMCVGSGPCGADGRRGDRPLHPPHPDPLPSGEREKLVDTPPGEREKLADIPQGERESSRDNDTILKLAAEGSSGAEIARALGLSCAEVNLVLGINKIARN